MNKFTMASIIYMQKSLTLTGQKDKAQIFEVKN